MCSAMSHVSVATRGSSKKRRKQILVHGSEAIGYLQPQAPPRAWGAASVVKADDEISQPLNGCANSKSEHYGCWRTQTLKKQNGDKPLDGR